MEAPAIAAWSSRGSSQFFFPDCEDPGFSHAARLRDRLKTQCSRETVSGTAAPLTHATWCSGYSARPWESCQHGGRGAKHRAGSGPSRRFLGAPFHPPGRRHGPAPTAIFHHTPRPPRPPQHPRPCRRSLQRTMVSAAGPPMGGPGLSGQRRRPPQQIHQRPQSSPGRSHPSLNV